jgi:hypothetical protein
VHLIPLFLLHLPLILTLLGGHGALILTAPVTALTEVHSFAGVVAILNGLSGPQRIEVARLLISNQPNWLKRKERALLREIIEQGLRRRAGDDDWINRLPTGTPQGEGGTFTGWK